MARSSVILNAKVTEGFRDAANELAKLSGMSVAALLKAALVEYARNRAASEVDGSNRTYMYSLMMGALLTQKRSGDSRIPGPSDKEEVWPKTESDWEYEVSTSGELAKSRLEIAQHYEEIAEVMAKEMK